MAKRRMFSLDIVNSDDFLDMGVGSRELYFQLGMNADDDGFITPKRVMRMVGATDDDLRVLVAKRFILPFENGVIVIKHWRTNNYIQSDRYQETRHVELKQKLYLNENKDYTDRATKVPLLNPKRIQNVYKKDTQVRLGKVRLGKNKVSNDTVEMQSIYDHFILQFGKDSSKYKLTEKRKLKLKARLKDAGADMLRAAINNVAGSAWHMGDNDRGWTADLDFIIRSYEQVEKLSQMGESNKIVEYKI